MPVYEYRCPTCSQIFEKLVSMSASGSDVLCPDCGTRASKLISTFAAVGSRDGGAPTVMAGPGAGGGCCGGGCCGGGD